jgi:putative endonuclease
MTASGSHQQNRATGRRGEELAVRHLRGRGLTILARNLRTAAGEIDLIAADGSTVVFVEVKTSRARRGSSPAEPGSVHAAAAGSVLERLGPGQRRRLRGLALDWLREQPAALRSREQLRFDANGVLLGPGGELLVLEHLEGAW